VKTIQKNLSVEDAP